MRTPLKQISIPLEVQVESTLLFNRSGNRTSFFHFFLSIACQPFIPLIDIGREQSNSKENGLVEFILWEIRYYLPSIPLRRNLEYLFTSKQ